MCLGPPPRRCVRSRRPSASPQAREEYDPDSASSQWFWLLFDSDLTPAGKNLLDGRYACFGYTVDGARLLSDVKEGDIIASAKVSSGESNLVLPTAPALAAAAE